MNYKHYAVYEVAQQEIATSFIKTIKHMDSSLAERRLSILVKSNSLGASFISIAAQFMSLVGHETCVDDE